MVTSTRIRLITTIMTLSFLLSCGTQTVNRNSLTVDELKDFAVMSLKPGDVIRYSLTESSQRLEGVVQQTVPDGLYVHSNDERVFLATDSIEWLWLRRRSWKIGATVGAIPGFVVVSAITAFAMGIEGETSIWPAINFGLIGALATGTVGGVIGAVVPRWELLF